MVHLEYVELASQLNLPAQEEEADFHTVAGLNYGRLQSIPDVGDFIDYHGWRFEVVEKRRTTDCPCENQPFARRGISEELVW